MQSSRVATSLTTLAEVHQALEGHAIPKNKSNVLLTSCLVLYLQDVFKLHRQARLVATLL